MASSISNPDSDTSLESNRKKRRKIESPETSESVPAEVKWRSPSVQSIYAVKLVEALQRAREPSSPPPSVRNVADRVLAVAAKGTTRWSRAILASRLRLSRRRLRKVPARAAERRRRRKVAPVEKRVKILRRLVPGCRGLGMRNVLEETGDYIAALEMQVRAMTALAELLAGAQSDRLPPASSN